MTLSHTPADVVIKPRHPAFDLSAALGRDWHGGDAFKTAFFNALSLTFPIGETYFIDSVRAFQKEVTEPKLAAEIRGFIGQEAIHRREHTRYNETLCRQRGYDLAAIEGPFAERIRQRDAVSRYSRLLETVAFEHLTAILAHGLLTDPAWLAGADETMATLWRWHAIEEAEHKAVTFDVYAAVGGDPERLRAALTPVTRQLFADVLGGVRVMLQHRGRARAAADWVRGSNWLFGRPGVARRLYPEWRAFLREDFHPWQHDNRNVIEGWKRTSEPALLLAA